MKKIFLLVLFLGVCMLNINAQDDMYTVSSKPKTVSRSVVLENERSEVYNGSNRDVDEYNRRGKYWSHYQKIGTNRQGRDIISFKKGRGVYPDSTYIDTTFIGEYYDTMMDRDDYQCTRRMSRWDGFYDPWFYQSYCWGTYPAYHYWRYRWGWYDPWYSVHVGFYDPWYSPWYSPWYYGYSYPYGYYGYTWGYPYYYDRYYVWNSYPIRYEYRTGHTGSLDYYDRSNYGYSNTRRYNGTYGNRRSNQDVNTYNRRYNNSQSNVTFGSRRPSGQYNSPTNTGRRNSTPTYQAPVRSSGSSFGGGTRNNNSSGGFRGGGSFGGGRR